MEQPGELTSPHEGNSALNNDTKRWVGAYGDGTGSSIEKELFVKLPELGGSGQSNLPQ